MALNDGMLRPPSLADDLNDYDRRLRVVEFGDPHDVNALRTYIQQEIHESSLRDNTLFENDVALHDWLDTYYHGLDAWLNSTLPNWILQHVGWAIREHERAYHGIPNPQPTQPSFPTTPRPPNLPTMTPP